MRRCFALAGMLAALSLQDVKSQSIDLKFDTRPSWYVPQKTSSLSVSYRPHLSSLSSSLTNSQALPYVITYCQTIFIGDALGKAKERYYARQNSLLVNLLGLSLNEMVDGKTNSPSESVNSFFKISENMRDALAKGPVALSTHSQKRQEWNTWKYEFRSLLIQEFDTLETLLALTSQLSKSKSPKGMIFRNMLQNKGITKPEYLVSDLEVIRKHVLFWYDLDSIQTLGALFTPLNITQKLNK
ncbi:MAG: hypothetical protein AABY00_01535 [Nanoarchaeota archaeon]